MTTEVQIFKEDPAENLAAIQLFYLACRDVPETSVAVTDTETETVYACGQPACEDTIV